MALEDIESAGKFIDDLNKNNPVGSTDAKNEGDNHIRGIKNVLLLSFPSINSAMTVSSADLNGFFATSNQMMFAQTSPPVGWTQNVSSDASNRFLRIVDTVGGGIGGTDSPVTHTHTTGNHALSVGELPSHNHTYLSKVITVQTGTGAIASSFSTVQNTSNTGGDNSHNHGTTGSYDPKFLNSIVCIKD